MLKIFRLFSVLILSSTVFSQEGNIPNAEFLASLPDDVRAQVLDQNRDTEEVFINPKTRIETLEREIQNAASLLDKIQYEVSKNNNISQQSLIRYGENFFTSFQSTFKPISEVAADLSYVLDVGDYLTVQYVGSVNRKEKVAIQRDGSINLMEYGKLFIKGLTFKEARELINTNISQSLLGVKSFVTLSELRDMNIMLVGNVKNPGLYTIEGGSAPLAVLYAAGGINEVGSYRDISHFRDGKKLQNIDLYDLFFSGIYSAKFNLRSGDVLRVNKKLIEVSISGNVASPAKYEVLNNETLEDILEKAEPLSNSDEAISISRINGNENIQLSVNQSEANGFKISNGDYVSVFGSDPELEGPIIVELKGEVLIPGSYTLSKGKTLSDLIKLAGGYTEMAYPLGGVLSRQKAKNLEQSIKEKSTNELIRFLVAAPNRSAQLAPEGIIQFISLLNNYEPSGRVIANFNLNDSATKKSSIFLENGDEIIIPKFSNTISVFGEVLNPGTVMYSSENNAKDYIKLVGGLSSVADSSRIVVISPNGETQSFSSDGFFNFANGNNDILPGTLIYVPREVGKLDGLNFAAVVAPIVSSIALSLASLNSIN